MREISFREIASLSKPINEEILSSVYELKTSRRYILYSALYKLDYRVILAEVTIY